MTAEDRSTTPQLAGSLDFAFRRAAPSDAAAIWRLVVDSGVLDPNSLYCYLILCRDFSDTCVVACRGSAIVGFVLAYCPPRRPQTVFVWQIGVAASTRGQGVGNRLLHELLSLPACREVKYLEATVTPSNIASRRLFQSLAKDLMADCQLQPEFTADMFGSAEHEEEELFRIGPFDDGES